MASGAALIGLTSAPAHADGAVHHVRFQCTDQVLGSFGWVAPAGVTSITVEVAGGAGGSNPGNSGRGGHGAVVRATLAIPQPIVFGDIGCSGDSPSRQFIPGGPGGSAAGRADAGASGGDSTFF